MKGTCEALRVNGRQGVLYLSPGEGPRSLLVACCGDELEAMLPDLERALAPQLGRVVSPFALASLREVDWDADYTPWPSTELNGREMAGRADALLGATQGPLLSAALDRMGGAARLGILGYSLGGLFALYAASKADSPFDCAASVSGALWYERFADYAAAAPFRS